MSVIGSTIAKTDRYDWLLMLGSPVLALVVILLNAPLWAVVIIGFAGPAFAGVRGTCHDLGLLGDRDAGKQGAVSVPSDTNLKTDARSSSTRPASLRPRPPATDKP